MQQLDFKDFYRFVASLGLVIVLAGFLFPWLLLHDSSLFVIPQTQPASQTMQAAVELRAAYILFAVNHLLLISATLMGLGSIITGLGLFQWWKRQQTLDTKENLELEKLKRELKPLTKEQAEEKAVAESDEYIPLSEQEEYDAPLQRISVRQHKRKINDYRKSEELILGMLEKANSTNYEILKERTLGAAQYDAVLLSKLLSKPDIIVEVKIIKKGFHWGWLSSVIQVLALSVDFYSTRTRRKARGLLLIVAPANVLNQGRIRAQYPDSIRALLANMQTNLAVRFVDVNLLSKKSDISKFSESVFADSSVNLIIEE